MSSLLASASRGCAFVLCLGLMSCGGGGVSTTPVSPLPSPTPILIPIGAPVTVVQGNVDAGLPFKLTEIVTLAQKKFLIHHIVNPWALAETVAHQLAKQKPDAVIFGHTHRPFAQVLDGVLFFNPGYAGKPKLGAERSVAILQVVGREIMHEFISL